VAKKEPAKKKKKVTPEPESVEEGQKPEPPMPKKKAAKGKKGATPEPESAEEGQKSEPPMPKKKKVAKGKKGATPEPESAEEEQKPEPPTLKKKAAKGRKGATPEPESAEEEQKPEPPMPKKKAAKGKTTPLKVEEQSEEEGPAVKSKKSLKAKVEATKAKGKKAAAGKAKEKKVETTGSDPEASATESDKSDREVESDVEKPAITNKARKEVQAKLTSKGTKVHPYPDWEAGTPVPYAALVKTFSLIEATTKRLEKMSHTSLFLRQVLRLSPDELLLAIHLMINRLAADYEGVELGIGETLLMKAICESCGRTMSKLKEDHRLIGDLGEIAQKSRNTQRTLFPPKPLTVRSVHAGLKEIALIKGDGGQGRKVDGIKKLLSAAQGDEAKFLVRGLEGKLRLGLAEKTVIVGLSQAVIVHEAEKDGKKAPSLEQMTAAEATLKGVYSELPNYEIIIPEMMKAGILNLKDTCKLQPGVPLKPMLAKPTKAISEVLDRFEGKRFTCEYKYDGERVQIHYVAPNSSVEFPTIDPKKGIAKIFSRNSEELSPKYPDILAALNKWVQDGVESFVLDCEAVAWDRDEKRVLPFQQLMTRKRKDVAIEDVKVKVCVFGFDLLFLNGKVGRPPPSVTL